MKMYLNLFFGKMSGIFLRRAKIKRSKTATEKRSMAPKNGGMPIRLNLMAIQVVPQIIIKRSRMNVRNVAVSALDFR